MGRSKFSPVKPDGNLRNDLDKLLLIALALGLTVDDHCRINEESKEASNRALQTLQTCLRLGNRYAVLAWAMNGRRLALEKLRYNYPDEAYQTWLQLVDAFRTSPLETPQKDLLLSYAGTSPKTLHTHWSQPHKHAAIAEILAQTGLSANGQTTYAMLVAATAYNQQLFSEQFPGPGAYKLITPAGITVSISGPPGTALENTLATVTKALRLESEIADAGPAG